jgi:hypothetical protein
LDVPQWQCCPALEEQLAIHQQATAAAAANKQVTIESLIAEAEAARVMAMELKKPGEAIRAIETIAKLCGLWKEKPDAHNQFNGPVTFEVHYTRESAEPKTIEHQAEQS